MKCMSKTHIAPDMHAHKFTCSVCTLTNYSNAVPYTVVHTVQTTFTVSKSTLPEGS